MSQSPREPLENPPTPPMLTNTKAARAFLSYDPDDLEDSIRDDLENSNFPSINNPAQNNNPAARLMELAIIHGDYEAVKQLDNYFIKFEISKTPMDRIAKLLDVEVGVARKFYDAYKIRARRAIERLEVNDVLAGSINALSEVESEFYKIATTPNMGTREKLAALKGVANTEMLKLDALEKNRFYERKGYASNDAGLKDPSKKPQFIMNILQNIFSGEPVDGDSHYKQLEETVYEAEIVDTDETSGRKQDSEP